MREGGVGTVCLKKPSTYARLDAKASEWQWVLSLTLCM